MNCTVYRCSRQLEMYLYVADGEELDELPQALTERLGRLTEVMQLELTPERKLARVDAAKVVEALTLRGYFLQMPPEGGICVDLNNSDA